MKQDSSDQPMPSLLTPAMKNFFNEAGEMAAFAGRFFREFLFPPYEFKEVAKQGYETGYRSLPLVGLTSFIIGLVFTLQSRPTLVSFGAEAWLPAMVSVSIVREIGPVIV